MLMTINEAVMVETGKVDRKGNKIEKPEAIYYYCGQNGRDRYKWLAFKLLHIFTKSLKWLRKLLIHLFNMVILNAHILDKVL